MYSIIETPILGIILTILAFDLGLKLSKRINISLFHPLLIAVCLIIIVLTVCQIPLANYQIGGSVITYFLSPLTVVLALPLYRQLHHIKKNFFPIIGGITIGLLTGAFLTTLLGSLFNISNELLISIVPKSITTPIALSLTDMLGGIDAITTIFVVISGVLGAIISPIVYRYYQLDNSVAKGVGIGASSHAVGTSKAMEMGETEGATSSASIGLTGLIAILIIPAFLELLSYLGLLA